MWEWRRGASWVTWTAAAPSSRHRSTSAAAHSGSPERDEGHGQQPLVLRAEVDDAPVQRPVAGPADLAVIVAGELGHGERGEHELAVEAQQIEGPAALAGVERAQGAPALGVHEPVLELGAGGAVDLAGGGLGDGLLGQAPGPAELQAPDAVPHLLLDVAAQPVGQLHDVAVGVVVRASLGVRHERIPL